MLGFESALQSLNSAIHSLGVEITSPKFYLQLAIILGGMAAAWLIGAVIRKKVTIVSITMGLPITIRLMIRALINNASYAAFALLMVLARLVMLASTWPSRSYLLVVAAKLAAAWLVVQIATSVVRNALVVKILSISLWTIAALSILNVLDPTAEALDSIGVDVGGFRLTPLMVINLAIFLAITMWVANLISNFFENRIRHSQSLTPSVQVLLSKLIRVALLILAAAMALNAVGINLGALAIFSGAVGVGIGFGLQKIVSNFISGMILLADKSVKPGDLISIGDNQGRITAMNTRFISVAAGDGREILIPNEDLITQKVVNWTYTDKNTLVKIPFSASFDADPRMVCKLAIGVAAASPRVIAGKTPSCQLGEFTETGIRYTLSLWIGDPDGVGDTRSDVMIRLWEAFKAEGIKVPHPVREIRLRDGASLSFDSAAEADEAGPAR